MGEFILPYDAVRDAEAPDEMLLEFLQTTYYYSGTFWSFPRKIRYLGQRGTEG